MLDRVQSKSPPLPYLSAFMTALNAPNHEEPPQAARERTSSTCSYATAYEEPSSAKITRDHMHESETDMEITPSYVPADEYNRVLRDNTNISQELQRTKEDIKKAESEAKVATIAFRTLADWAYNERKQLLEVTGTQISVADTRRAITARSDQLLREQIQRSDAAWARFTKDLLARREQVEGVLLAIKDGRARTEVDASNLQTLDHAIFQPVDASFVADQVDQLIAEEKARLPHF
ncbi:hypothetical protein BDU57DRAFT_534533 [Ampelomyces quisqualis]|uniref:Uncharacterized protein n=1 Tax=Ampelomyces quisqualis TaxID=50730 RepID=A0A6A5R4A5_AMPQU|nr:hypothetical protein BDU57DRAFT_534533 [Ampelomyces quisqualis]